MSDPESLYRSSALEARRTDFLGSILLSTPPPLGVLAGAATVFVAALIAYFWFGAFSSQVTLNGQLVPDLGLVAVRSPQTGIVLERRVRPGEHVRRGDVLMLLSGERWSDRPLATHDRIATLLDSRRDTLQGQKSRLHMLEQHELASLQNRQTLVAEDQALLEATLNLQRQRLDQLASVVTDFGRLVAEGHVSAEQERTVQDQWLEQRTRTNALEREYLAAALQRDQLAHELAALPVRYATQRAELELALAGVDQDRLENDWRRRFAVVAPVDGVLVAVSAEIGTVVDAQMPLFSMVPAGATLQAHLDAPETVVWSVAHGDRLRLRFEAFPDQKFGHHSGRVVDIAGAPVPQVPDGMQPVYRVTVELDSQQVALRGRSVSLQPGMRVQARVAVERRRLLEWAFASI